MSLFTYGESPLCSALTRLLPTSAISMVLIGLFYVMAEALWLLAYCSSLIMVVVVYVCVRAHVYLIGSLCFLFNSEFSAKALKMAITHPLLCIYMQMCTNIYYLTFSTVWKCFSSRWENTFQCAAGSIGWKTLFGRTIFQIQSLKCSIVAFLEFHRLHPGNWKCTSALASWCDVDVDLRQSEDTPWSSVRPRQYLLHMFRPWVSSVLKCVRLCCKHNNWQQTQREMQPTKVRHFQPQCSSPLCAACSLNNMLNVNLPTQIVCIYERDCQLEYICVSIWKLK